MDNKKTTWQKAAFYGSIAVFFWAICAYLLCLLKNVPLFQLLALVQLIGGALCMRIESKKAFLPRLQKRLLKGAPFLLLFMATQICYMYAFRAAPAAHVDLINYLWPTFVIVGGTLSKGTPLSRLHILGIGSCFMGLIVLFLPDILNTSMRWSYLSGYGAAMGSAVSWALYTILGGQEKNHKTIGEDVFLAGCCFAFFHSTTGQWILPSWSEVLVIAFMAIFVYGLAYPLWKKATESGHDSIVGGLGNVIPLFSILFLVIGGIVQATGALLASSLLITLGCYFLGKQAHQAAKVKRRLRPALDLS